MDRKQLFFKGKPPPFDTLEANTAECKIFVPVLSISDPEDAAISLQNEFRNYLGSKSDYSIALLCSAVRIGLQARLEATDPNNVAFFASCVLQKFLHRSPGEKAYKSHLHVFLDALGTIPIMATDRTQEIVLSLVLEQMQAPMRERIVFDINVLLDMLAQFGIPYHKVPHDIATSHIDELLRRRCHYQVVQAVFAFGNPDSFPFADLLREVMQARKFSDAVALTMRIGRPELYEDVARTLVEMQQLQLAESFLQSCGVDAVYPDIEAEFFKARIHHLLEQNRIQAAVVLLRKRQQAGAESALQVKDEMLVETLVAAGRLEGALRAAELLGIEETFPDLRAQVDDLRQKKIERASSSASVFSVPDESILFVNSPDSAQELVALIRDLLQLSESEKYTSPGSVEADDGLTLDPRLAVGVDVEWRPDHGSGERNPASLLQIAFEAKAVVIDLYGLASAWGSEVLAVLGDLFHSKLLVKVGYGLIGDFVRLLGSFSPAPQCFEHVASVVDLTETVEKIIHKTQGWSTLTMQGGLASVVEEWLGSRLDKRAQRSDWDRRPLSPSQLRYAAADAACLLPLYEIALSRHREDVELSLHSLIYVARDHHKIHIAHPHILPSDSDELNLLNRPGDTSNMQAHLPPEGPPMPGGSGAGLPNVKEGVQVPATAGVASQASVMAGVAPQAPPAASSTDEPSVAPLTVDHVKACLLAKGHADVDVETGIESGDLLQASLPENEVVGNALCFVVTLKNPAEGSRQEVPVLVVESWDRKVDTRVIARHVGCPRRRVRMASRHECVALFGYVPGSISPVGLRPGVRVFLDPILKGTAAIHASAGAPHTNMRLATDKLLELTGGEWLTLDDVATSIATGSGGPSAGFSLLHSDLHLDNDNGIADKPGSRFICDPFLGRLCRRFRSVGIDSALLTDPIAVSGVEYPSPGPTDNVPACPRDLSRLASERHPRKTTCVQGSHDREEGEGDDGGTAYRNCGSDGAVNGVYDDDDEDDDDDDDENNGCGDVDADNTEGIDDNDGFDKVSATSPTDGIRIRTDGGTCTTSAVEEEDHAVPRRTRQFCGRATQSESMPAFDSEGRPYATTTFLPFHSPLLPLPTNSRLIEQELIKRAILENRVLLTCTKRLVRSATEAGARVYALRAKKGESAVPGGLAGIFSRTYV
eukprot:Rmarinus@m.29956